MHTLKLLLSALISSWQFFKESAQAPTIKYSTEDNVWQDFCLRPSQNTLKTFFKSIFFNAKWNEYLFLVDCAERLLEERNIGLEAEIKKRISAQLNQESLTVKLIFETGESYEF